MEGFHCDDPAACDPSGLTLPVMEYSHDQGNCSVTGGGVYRGGFYPNLSGFYLYGDYCSGRIWGLRRNGETWENTLLLDTPYTITTFGADVYFEFYAPDIDPLEVYQLAADNALVPFSSGIVAWQGQTTGLLDIQPFSPIPTASLVQGTYLFLPHRGAFR